MSGLKFESNSLKYARELVNKEFKGFINMKRNDNNGWLHIDGYDDIPQEITESFVYNEDGDVGYYTFGLVSFTEDYTHCLENGVTHYQPIVKPEPPTE